MYSVRIPYRSIAMARTVRNAKIDTRSARAKLKARREPYWTSIQPGCAIGYRKGATGGTWIARYYNSTAVPKLRYHALGTADDAMDGDDSISLSFAQAQTRARKWFGAEARKSGGLDDDITIGPYRVRDAVGDYLKWYNRRGGKSLGATVNVAEVHILPKLGDIELRNLTPKKIRDWHLGIAEAEARVRLGRTGERRYRASTGDDEAKRRRRATANRVLTVLKAALNHAWREGKTASDEAWRRVTPFQNVDTPVVRYLTAAECKRLVNAAKVDFRQLVQAALFTGCRYSELAALQISDFNPDADTLTVRTSKSGKPRHVVLNDEARNFFHSITPGRNGTECMFIRGDGKPWGASHQQRPMAEACKAAQIEPAVSFHVLRHTHGSLLAMQGVPMPVIARQLGHSDTRMTEKHYAHLSPDYIADTIRANFPKLGINSSSKVTRLG